MILTHGKGKRNVPLGVSRRASVWVVLKVSNALMHGGVLEVSLHYVRTNLAGKRSHVEVVEEACIYGLASDPMFLHSGGSGR